MHALHAKENEQRIIEAGQILHSGRIEALLIKGWDAARLYPKTGLRPYGDIDLVVRPADAERAEELLAGTAAGERTDLVHDVETDGCSLEELFGAAQPAEVAATAETESRMLVPSSEDRLRILSLHTLKHGAWRPLWLCDIAAGAEGAGSDFDWERCLSPDERIRDWVVTALALAGRLLGADLAGTPSAGRDVPAWLTRAVLEQWNAPFPERHGVLLEPMSRVRNPGRVPRALRRRWADPVTATISRGKRFDEAPRLPLQLADAFGRTVRFMSGSQDSRAYA
jgi:hypothetical protein